METVHSRYYPPHSIYLFLFHNIYLSYSVLLDLIFPFSTSAENFYIYINLLPSSVWILNNKMLRKQLLSVALLVFCLTSIGNTFCPAPGYRGNIYSGIILLIQLKLSLLWMEDPSLYSMEKILNATITVCRMRLRLFLMSPSLSIVFRHNPLTISSSISSLLDPKVFHTFHFW